jgi:hypothetical protein
MPSPPAGAAYSVLSSSPTRQSDDSDDSQDLRALELTEGPLDLDHFPSHRTSRLRSYSIGGFDFQHDLLPLSTSLSDPDLARGMTTEKNFNLLNGIVNSPFALFF